MADSLLHEAVRNNALWCDAVCRAHGRPGEFREGVCWLNRRETPPFYPNVVTLTDAPEVSEEQTACVRSLAGSSELPGEWAVKDSYHALDLAPLGFTVLFAGEWLYLPAGASPPPGHTAGIRWERIEEAGAIADWEAAWGGPERAGEPRVFLPPLLADPDVAILAARRNGGIVAGAVAHRTGAVVGLSNVFLPPRDAGALRSDCVAAAASAFPGLPLVGYEAGDDLAAMKALGCESLGPLRVWLRHD